MNQGQNNNSGERGFNKPPSGPYAHVSTGRMRLSTHDANGTPIKDRYGTPRERSPTNFGTSVPLSPSHMAARESSPNPSPQNLHDCSMCFSAYIQSLNTVCGTACRLAQCLAQVGARGDEGSNNETNGAGPQLPQLLKEVADTWEGIARSVGVTSTSVKTQMLILLQETQARHAVETTDAARKYEATKMMRTMLSTFLNLHCQFSMVALERFSGVLQHLNEDSTNSVKAAQDGKPIQNPSPVSSQSQNPYLSPQILQQHQLSLMQQTQQQLPIQQHMILQHMLRLNSNVPPGAGDSGQLHIRENGAKISASSPVAFQTSLAPPLWSPSIGSSIDSFSSQNTGSFIAPGFNALSLIGLDTSNEALLRRWSMGCAAEEARQNKLSSSLSPFNLINSRRWSVPETRESDHRAWMVPAAPGGWDYRGGPSPSCARGRGVGKRGGFGKEGARSPSHSRSVTPDESRRVSLVSNEELHDVIELLSLPLISRDECGMSSFSPRPSWKQFYLAGGNAPEPSAHHDRIPENENESSGGFSSSPSRTLSSPTINDTSLSPLSPVLSEKGKPKEMDASPFQQSIWAAEKSPEKNGTPNSGPSVVTSMSDFSKGHINQISTSLWPPTGNVPGVTLTECVGEMENREIPPWSDDGVCYDDSSGMICLDRGCINRASWPISTFTNYGMVEDILSGSCPSDFQRGWDPRPNLTTFRRHSTDAPYLIEGGQSSLTAKTRSFENISPKLNEGEFYQGETVPGPRDDLFLPSLNLAFPSTSSPSSSQYSLFATSN